jgi:hypothetical protein
VIKSLLSAGAAVAALSALSIGSAVPAAADPLFDLISEVRGGLLVHDVLRDNSNKTRESNSIDVNGELLSVPWVIAASDLPVLGALLRPRADLGFTANTAGWTNTVYGGATWEWGLGAGFFLDASFGLAGHDGQLKNKIDANGAIVDTGRPNLGSPVLFRESGALGYRLPSGHSLSIDLSHMSHAGLFASQNDGLTFLGVRYGYKFD